MPDRVVIRQLDARLLDVHLAHDVAEERDDANFADQRAELQVASCIKKRSELPLSQIERVRTLGFLVLADFSVDFPKCGVVNDLELVGLVTHVLLLRAVRAVATRWTVRRLR